MSSSHFDQLETRDPASREQAQFNLLPSLIERAMAKAPGWAAHLKGVDAKSVTSRAALAVLPVLRKSDLKDAQTNAPPFGNFAIVERGSIGRICVSPGPPRKPKPPRCRSKWVQDRTSRLR